MKKALVRFLASCSIVGVLVGQAGAETLLPNGKQTFVDLNGAPLAAGTVGFYVPNTLTPKTTWRDAGSMTPNSNPVVLDAAGRAIIYGSGVYRQIVKDVFGNVVWDELTTGEGGGSGTLTTTSTIATLRAIGAGSGAGIGNILVQDYYGTGYGCPIQYAWNASDTTPDNGGAVINPTGNGGAGRWNLNLSPKSPVHSCVFGVVADSTPGAGNGTDQAAQLQALLTWASGATGPNWVHIDGKKDLCIRVGASLVPGEGEIIEGDGEFPVVGSTNKGTCLSFTASSGYLFALQTPYPGFGLTTFESPKFNNLSMLIFDSTASNGGCIQLNSIAGGFTDTNASQQPLMHPRFTNLYCNMRVNSSVTKIGIQVSKAADGLMEQVDTFGGVAGVDIEGSENFTVRNGVISSTYGSNLVLAQHGTFGNNNVVQNMQLLGFADLGQTVDSLLYDNARESTVRDNVFEALAPTVTTQSNIHLVNGLLANLQANTITNSTNWLWVDGTYQTINATGNATLGSDTGFGSAKFTAGKYLYSVNGIQSILNHSGNQSEGGWPFVSKSGLWDAAPKVREIYSPNYSGLRGDGYGFTEVPVNYSFTFPTTGAGDFLEFNPNSVAPMTGTFDAQILAWQQSGTGQITCQLTDGGTLVGASIAQNITATPTWYTLGFNQAVATSAAIRCWDTGGSSGGNSSRLTQINIVDH